MADPLPSGLPQPEVIDGADREARIEHLLVTGLDHYFAGEFESAINLWTRVLFLDRTHDRARAYIVRARTAQAEQQRATEALVHQGLEAFSRGEVDAARALLRDALDRGASHDLALGVLGRIDRLDVGQAMSVVPTTISAPRRAVPRAEAVAEVAPVPWARIGSWAVLVTAVAMAGVGTWWLAAGRPAAADWRSPRPVNSASVAAPVTGGPLPSPNGTEVYVNRGRALFAEGKLRDALRVLDRVPVGDAMRADAARVRGEIQRRLLDLAVAESTDAVAGPRPAAPRE